MEFASGLLSPESPFVLPDGSLLCVEMALERACVTRISRDGHRRSTVARTGRPNAVVVGGDGAFWVAETYPRPSLLRVVPDGEADVVVAAADGERFLWPNDLCFGPDGAIYLTDSGIFFGDWRPGGRLREDCMTVETDGRVYRIDVQTCSARTLDSGLRFANGIAFGPDGHLYVSETQTGVVYRYPFAGGRPSGGRETFGNTLDPSAEELTPGRLRGPDGMAFAANGALYVAVYGQRSVAVLAPDGSVTARIATEGLNPTNVAFGLAGEQRIYVSEAELGRIEMFDSGVDGAPLHRGASS